MNNQFALGLHLIKNTSYKNWLDVGCGTGDILRFTHIFESAPRKFTGLDISKELISYAKNNLPQYCGYVNFCNQNFTEQVEDEPFDLITCFGVLQKCGIELYEALNRLSSLLCKKGVLLISTKSLNWTAFDSPAFEPFSGHCWFSVNQLKGAFESADLDIVVINGFDALQNKYVKTNESHSVFIVGKKR
jgi:ubiquinone/menaquinone biosynthesis C-methylase UbiE